MEHFITEIRIDGLRHLSDITISLNPQKRQHLLITGKNGSGKTSLLLALKKYLMSIDHGEFNYLVNVAVPRLLELREKMEAAEIEAIKQTAMRDYQENFNWAMTYRDGVDIGVCSSGDLDQLFEQGKYIIAFFPADRKTNTIRARGVEDVRLEEVYSVDDRPGTLLHKYLVHLKTQQAYARNEGDMATASRIGKWFDRFVGALRILLDDESISLEYDYKEYDFKIHQKGREPFGFDMLSDGYSSVIYIVSDLVLRMDRNWLLGDGLSEYDVEGIALIDELETHLHIELQRKILPFLTSFFPRIQFIVTTHSPYILNSVSNAKAYDLERCVELENLSAYSSDGLVEGYFESEEYSDELKEKLRRYEYLARQGKLTEKERAERAMLRSELKNIPGGLAREAKEKFDEIEGNRL